MRLFCMPRYFCLGFLPCSAFLTTCSGVQEFKVQYSSFPKITNRPVKTVKVHWLNFSTFDDNKTMADKSVSKHSSCGFPSEKRKKLSHGDEKGEEFPSSLEEFGYEFVGGKLKNIETGEPFKFDVKKGDLDYNQMRYEALGEVITNYVYDLLVKEAKLEKCFLPLNATSTKYQSFVFHSKDVFSNEKLVILIHGTGVVRAGQWSRKLIINDCLDSGTQLPFIAKAQELGYGVLVLNTNDHISAESNGRSSPKKHVVCVWNELISKTKAKHIAIVAHSYGGIVTVHLCNSFPNECKKKIFAIAFTDSVHNFESQPVSADMLQWLQKVGRNWVTSNKPLGTPVRRKEGDINCVSAGTPTHEMTSWSSFSSVFQFLEQRYGEATSR